MALGGVLRAVGLKPLYLAAGFADPSLMSDDTGGSTENAPEPSAGLLLALALLLSFSSGLAGLLHIVPFDDGTWVAEHGPAGELLATASAVLHVVLPGVVIAALARPRGRGRALQWGMVAALLVVMWVLLILMAVLIVGCPSGSCD